MKEIQKHIAEHRTLYRNAELSEDSVNRDPMKQFEEWFNEALAAESAEPGAMTLATADAEGKPSARIVLLRGFDDKGFVFYTNYKSAKGKELIANPRAALVFFWTELERQVRIEGSVVKILPQESDEYFQSRPRESQIGAWASLQSHALRNREELEAAYRKFSEKYADQPVPRPAEWGGYRLMPAAIEFWQGRPNRLHDRLLFTREKNGEWKLSRLAP